MSKSNPNSSSSSNKSNVSLLRFKIMKYKNRLTFAYYSITFWNFKSRQGVLKIWKVLKAKNKFLKKMFKYQNTVYYGFKSRFFVIFSSNYRHGLVLKIPFPDHIFPKISIPCWKSSFPVYRQTLRPRPPALHISHCNVIYPSQDSSLYLASTLNVVNLSLLSFVICQVRIPLKKTGLIFS